MDIKKLIKNQDNFVLGAVFLILGIFLVTAKNLTGRVISKLGSFWAHPLTYIRILGWGFVIFSGLLVLFSLFGKTKKLSIKFGFEAAITTIALIVYCIVMPILTFFPTTFLLVLGINLLYKRKEDQAAIEIGKNDNGAEKSSSVAPSAADAIADKNAKKKSLIVSIIYSACITAFMWWIFSKVLKAVLP
jgi:hypothetical protein